MSSSLPAVTPMAPTLAKPFHRPGWVFEEKYDGWRMIAYKNGSAVRLVSRNAVDHTERGLGLRTAKALLNQGRERSSSPLHDFRLSRGVTWLEPTLHVEVTHSQVMKGRLRDPVYRGVV